MKSFITEWQKFFKSLDPNQKVSLGIASLVVIAGMVGLIIWAQKPQMRLLYGALSEKDAAAIVSHLDAQGIKYEVRSGGGSIFVPERDVYKARMDVVSQGVVQGDAVGFEIFDKSSFGASDFIQRTNFIRAIQGELARTIAQLHGVYSARVMVVMPDNRLLLVNNDLETTASVFVDVGGGTLNPAAVRSIQALVANAVEGLPANNVAVVDNHGNVLSEEREEDSMVAGSSSILEYRESVENYFSKKVETMLERVVGRGNAVVRVFADIDSEQMSRVEENFDETSPVVRSQNSQTETRTTVEGVNVSEDEAGAVPTPGQTDEEVVSKDQEYEIDKVVTNVVRNPGTVQRLTASVFVAAAPSGQQVVADDPNAQVVYETRSAEQLSQLQTIVANALGIDPQDETTGTVTIQEMVFTGDPVSVLSPAPEESSFNLTQILQFGEEIVGSIVALVLFVVFFQMYRKFKSQPSPFEEFKQQSTHFQGGGAQAAAQVTPELLNELIRQKPENAAVTLRGWINETEAE